MTLDAEGKLQRNLEQPIQKDTVMIPRRGYTIVRFKADNPGECIHVIYRCNYSILVLSGFIVR